MSENIIDSNQIDNKFLFNNYEKSIEDVFHNIIKLKKNKILIISWDINHGFWYTTILYHNSMKTIDLTHKKSDIKKLITTHKKDYNLKHIKISVDVNINFNNEEIKYLEILIGQIRNTDIIHRNMLRDEMILSSIINNVKNPLNSIIQMSNNMISNKKDIIIQHLEYLQNSSINLANNIFDIIDFYKLEINKLKIFKDSFAIKDLADSIVNIFDKNKKKLDYILEDNIPEFIISDSKRIKQILINNK